MTDFTGKHFGLLIAYVLPGFIVIWGAQPLSPMLTDWLSSTPSLPAGLAAVVFVGLASVAAGMTVSAFRWLIVDTAHAWTGLPRPLWDDAALPDKLDAFEAIVEAHYRYYQFYANAFIASLFVVAVAFATDQAWAASPTHLAVLAAIDTVFVLMSRDTLRKYYRRSARLLGIHSERKEEDHGKRP